MEHRNIHRMLTAALINENPEELVFKRSQTAQDGAGGIATTTVTTLPPQIGRRLKQGTQGSARTLPTGRIISPDYVLLMQADADVQPQDTVEINGDPYVVMWVELIASDWCLHAEVVRHGRI